MKTHHLNNSDSEIIVMTSDEDNANSVAKQRPTRLTKKPKVYEDFETSSPNLSQPQANETPSINV